MFLQSPAQRYFDLEFTCLPLISFFFCSNYYDTLEPQLLMLWRREESEESLCDQNLKLCDWMFVGEMHWELWLTFAL